MAHLLTGTIRDDTSPADILQMTLEDMLDIDEGMFDMSLNRRYEMLLTAIHKGHIVLVKEFLDQGYLQLHNNKKTSEVDTSAIHLACSQGNEDVVKLLVDHGANIHHLAQDPASSNEQYKSAFAVAMKHDRPNLIKLLLPLHQPQKDMYNRNPLHFACEEGAYECTKYLVEQYPDSVNVRMHDLSMMTPLMLAVKQNSKFVKLLLDKGADINMETPNKHREMLHLLFSNTVIERQKYFLPRETVNIAKLLISAGADVNHMGHSMETPLYQVCSQIMTELHPVAFNKFPYTLNEHHMILKESVQVLLDNGAELNLQTRDAPLNVVLNAIQTAMETIMGCNRNQSRIDKSHVQSTLTFALHLLEMLLESGASPDNFNVYFLSPLTQVFVHLHACRHVSPDTWPQIWSYIDHVVHLLLLHGAQEVDIKEAFWYPVYSVNIIEKVLHALPQKIYRSQLTSAESKTANQSPTNEDNVIAHHKWLGTLAHNPRMLLYLAPAQVYEHLRYRLKESVPKLPLPPLLKKYILHFE